LLGHADDPQGEVALQSALSRLKDAVTVHRRGLTYVISVGARSHDPQKAAQLANAVAQAYIEEQTRSKIEGMLAAREVLQARLGLARENMIWSQEELDRFINANIDLPEEPASIDAQLVQEADFEPEEPPQRTGASDLPVEVLTRLYEFQQSADLARNQYESLLARSGDLQVQAELQIADSRIVSRALPPSQPSFPNPPLILMLAGLGGLGLGVGLAFVYENFVGGFSSESQLGLVTRLPVVGDIPLQKLPPDARSVADTLISAPLSRYSESIRRARAGLDQHLRGMRDEKGEGGRVIMVSSSVPQEGKTALALSLARAYAQSGSKTLLIDCDLRRPAIHKHLGVEPAVGLFEFLAARTEAETLSSIIMRDEETRLSVIVGSKRSDIPTDQLITSNAFSRLVAAAAANFEVVILDTPPVLPVVDGLYLAQYADAVLLVVRWSSTAQTEVRAALGRFDQAKKPQAPVLAVLNQQVHGPTRYGKNYNGYYRG
jgi:capsular exopolysaccharide synthesis family protein